MTTSSLPPVRCATWCQYRNGHTNAVMASDQVCYSRPAESPLSIPQPRKGRDYAGDHLVYVNLSLRHDVPDARPIVETGLNEESGILLTLEEAEQYARAILHEVAAARGSSGERA